MTYKFYGDYGFETECLLEEFATLSEATRWVQGYTRRDMGGYQVIEVLTFANNNLAGEMILHFSVGG
jgi:hypothetical protein